MNNRLGDHLKLPFSQSMHEFGQKKAYDQIFMQGRKYPCTVKQVISPGIVQVNFEVNSPYTLPQPKVPVVGSEYVRMPIRPGDKGMCINADAKIGGITGLGSGVPDLTLPGNLAALAFIWLGNTEWAKEDSEGNPLDSEAVVIYSTLDCVLSVGLGGVGITGKAGSLYVEKNLMVGNGASGQFTTSTGQTVTVQNGIITNIY